MGYLPAGGSIQRVQTVVAVNQLEVEAREKRRKVETEGMVREEEAGEDAGGQSLVTEMCTGTGSYTLGREVSSWTDDVDSPVEKNVSIWF